MAERSELAVGGVYAMAGAFERRGLDVSFAETQGALSSAAMIGEGKTYTDSVVAVAITAPGPIGVGVAHGCSPRSAPSIVTKADGRTVLQLDGRRAEDVYLEKLGLASADARKTSSGGR